MLAPLKHVRVWRFSLYYVVVFGAYVALSAWLPDYYRTNYFADLSPADGVRMAALLTALFIFPASLLRPLGGCLSDRFGPRVVTYAVFVGDDAGDRPAVPAGDVLPLGVVAFTALLFLVGVGMGIGKASVLQVHPELLPERRRGGRRTGRHARGPRRVHPAASCSARWAGATGVPQAAFVALLALTLGSLVWLHLVVMRMKAAEKVAELKPEPVCGLAGRQP